MVECCAFCGAIEETLLYFGGFYARLGAGVVSVSWAGTSCMRLLNFVAGGEGQSATL